MADRAPTADPAAFILANTAVDTPPLVAEIRLRLATERAPIWHATEGDLAHLGVPPPFWAFAWAGGQALARYLLDTPETVAGKRVLDFGSGSGLVAIAAARAGAASVTASDIDPFAVAAIGLNADLNGVTVSATEDDLIGTDGPWDVVLTGDICYERPLAESAVDWLTRLSATGTAVLIGDPGRTFLPQQGLDWVIRYAVKTATELEDTDVRNAVVWRIREAQP